MASTTAVASHLGGCLRRHEAKLTGRTIGRASRDVSSFRWTQCASMSPKDTTNGFVHLDARHTTKARDVVSHASSSMESAHSTPRRSVILEPATCEIVSNDGGKFSLVGEMVLDADSQSVYAMLTDYQQSPRIFGTVDSVVVETMGNENEQTTEERENSGSTAQRGGASSASADFLVHQSCRWKFLVFGGAFPCSLRVTELPDKKYMEVTLHKKGFIREFQGSWTVTSEKGGGVRVRHALALRPALTPPYASKIFLKQIREILQDVENEVQGWDGAGYASASYKKEEKEPVLVTEKIRERVE